MDYFGLCMDALNLAGQGVMHIFFASRLTKKKQKELNFYFQCLIIT